MLKRRYSIKLKIMDMRIKNINNVKITKKHSWRERNKYEFTGKIFRRYYIL